MQNKRRSITFKINYIYKKKSILFAQFSKKKKEKRKKKLKRKCKKKRKKKIEE